MKGDVGGGGPPHITSPTRGGVPFSPVGANPPRETNVVMSKPPAARGAAFAAPPREGDVRVTSRDAEWGTSKRVRGVILI